MNDRDIYLHLAKNPGARAIDIAEALGANVTDVSQSLRALVDVGDVSKRQVFADDTGRPAQSYTLTEEFFKTTDGKRIAAQLASTPSSGAPKPEVKPTPSAPAEGKRISKVDRAINFLRDHGPCTSGQLRVPMDLPEKAHPQGYLQQALLSGKVVYADGKWSLGQNAPKGGEPVFSPPYDASAGKTVPEPKSIEGVIAGGTASIGIAPAANVGLAIPGKLQDAQKVAEVTRAPTRRCGIFTDGKIEMQRNGITLASMSREDADFFADYIIGLRAKAVA